MGSRDRPVLASQGVAKQRLTEQSRCCGDGGASQFCPKVWSGWYCAEIHWGSKAAQRRGQASQTRLYFNEWAEKIGHALYSVRALFCTDARGHCLYSHPFWAFSQTRLSRRNLRQLEDAGYSVCDWQESSMLQNVKEPSFQSPASSPQRDCLRHIM